MLGADHFDLITMGRVGVDIYPLQSNLHLEDVTSFGKYLGGSPTNVAVAAARHGHRVAAITRTGDDPFGEFIHRELRALGVDDRFVTPVEDLPTPVAFCEIFPPDNFPLYFYRFPKAPDLEIRADELDLETIAQSSVFWVTATGFSREPSRSAHYLALKARHRASHTILDLDYRSGFWKDRDAVRREMQSVLPLVTVAIGNAQECEAAIGVGDPIAAGRALIEMGVELAVVKRGPLGTVGVTADEVVEVPAVPVEVVNGLGAGDGFGGALCHGLLEGWPLDRLLRFANAAGAIVASRLECSTAMPTTEEVELMMQGEGHAPD